MEINKLSLTTYLFCGIFELWDDDDVWKRVKLYFIIDLYLSGLVYGLVYLPRVN